jgi:Fe-S-cluster-containing hydrogenase components 1
MRLIAPKHPPRVAKFEHPGNATGAESRTDFRWLMSSDVCKHCTHLGCLDVCPTGALFRTALPR